jgi:peptidoglycan/LPS O-acetylase OafA/YrhL
MSDRLRVDKGLWSILAGLRFGLAMWVLFDHTYSFAPFDHAIPFPTKSGYFAVFCFFLISGFSIHHSIVEEPTGYFSRRFWRIVPVNVVAVAIAWSAYSVFGLSGQYAVPETPPSIWEWVAYLLLLQGVFSAHISIVQPSWSVNIEALYYAAAPLLKKLSVTAMSAIGLASFVLLCAQPYVFDLPAFAKLFWAFAFLWVWLAGWIAYVRPFDKSYAAAIIVAGTAYLWLEPQFFDIGGMSSAAFNFIAWVLTTLILFFRWDFAKPAWADELMKYLGDLSFPIYLLHYPVLYVLTSTVLKSHPEWNYGILHVAVVVGVAAIVLKYFDRPLRHRSRRWFKST